MCDLTWSILSKLMQIFNCTQILINLLLSLITTFEHLLHCWRTHLVVSCISSTELLFSIT